MTPQPDTESFQDFSVQREAIASPDRYPRCVCYQAGVRQTMNCDETIVCSVRPGERDSDGYLVQPYD